MTRKTGNGISMRSLDRQRTLLTFAKEARAYFWRTNRAAVKAGRN